MALITTRTEMFDVIPLQINKRITRLEAMPFVANHSEFRSYMEPIMDRMVMELRSYCMAKVHKSEEQETLRIVYPDTPWQHFKKVYFPGWLLKKFPAKLKTLSRSFPVQHTYYMCPHASIKWDSRDPHIHLTFMNQHLEEGEIKN